MADTEALAELLAERDRLRRVTELQAATIEQQADSIQKIMEQSERRKEFADRLRAQVEDMRTAVHSFYFARAIERAHGIKPLNAKLTGEAGGDL